MGVHNEIGVIQPLDEIGKICRENNVFHSDCAQAIGKIPLNVDSMNLDLMSIPGHKIYGPKGIGALAQERREAKGKDCVYDEWRRSGIGMRVSTLSPALCVGLGGSIKFIVKKWLKKIKSCLHLIKCFSME